MPLVTKDGAPLTPKQNIDMRLNRLGKFSLPEHVIKLDLDAVRNIMANMVVVRAEFMWSTNAVEYTAISDLFEEVPTGMAAPPYNIGIRPNGSVFADKV